MKRKETNVSVAAAGVVVKGSGKDNGKENNTNKPAKKQKKDNKGSQSTYQQKKYKQELEVQYVESKETIQERIQEEMNRDVNLIALQEVQPVANWPENVWTLAGLNFLMRVDLSGQLTSSVNHYPALSDEFWSLYYSHTDLYQYPNVSTEFQRAADSIDGIRAAVANFHTQFLPACKQRFVASILSACGLVPDVATTIADYILPPQQPHDALNSVIKSRQELRTHTLTQRVMSEINEENKVANYICEIGVFSHAKHARHKEKKHKNKQYELSHFVRLRPSTWSAYVRRTDDGEKKKDSRMEFMLEQSNRGFPMLQGVGQTIVLELDFLDSFDTNSD